MAFLNETGLEQVWGKIKTKVNTIESTIDDINEAKVDKVSGKGLSTNDYTTAEKEKLAGIATGATKVIVDNTLSNTSTNAIQNKVVANMKSDIDDALSAKLDTITTSGDGNIITDISKTGTTLNAEKNAFATTAKEGNPVSEVGAAGAGFSVKTTFEPKQEGSGDPYPAGGGKNLLPDINISSGGFTSDGNGVFKCATSGNTNTTISTFLFKAGITYTISATTVSGTGYKPCIIVRNPTGNTTGQKNNYGSTDKPLTFSFDTDTNWNIILQTDTGNGLTTLNDSWTIQLEVGSAATEYAPYANIRPISSWTGAGLTRCGKNLLNPTLETITSYGITCKNNGNGTYTLNGTATENVRFILGGKVKLNKGISYKLLGAPDGCSNSTYYLYTGVKGKYYDVVDKNGVIATLDIDHETNLNAYVFKGYTVNNLVFKPMITTDLSATYDDFEPYTGDTFTADFGQTVYGGTLDWQTGVLTVDRALYTFDGSEGLTSGGWNNPYSYVLWAFLPDVVNCGMSDIADAYCSHYIVRSVADVITNAIAGFGIYDSGHLIFSSPTHADVDAFKSYLAAQYDAGTPVQVCYKLATPTTIQLTPHDLRMLNGINTVYSDGNTNYVIFNSGASSLAQVDKNYLKLTGGILTGSLHIKNSATWPNIIMKSTSYSDKNAGIIYNSIPSDSAVNYLGFRTYSRSSSDYSLLDYYENFELPSTSSNRTSNVSYSILTSKYAVTIPQGGTGATTASGARTNLEVPSKTGDGASGTWGINISGNAATATKVGTSTIGDTQTPIYLNGGTPTICSTYNNRIYAYDSAPYYTYSFGGGQDLNWKKIFSASDTTTAPSSATYHGATIKGKIFYTTSNYNAGEVREYDFVMYATFISATSIMDSCILKVSAGCPDTIIRAVRVSTNSFELQVRQPTDWHKICVQFCYRSTGATVSHCAPTDSSNSDVIAFSRLETSKYISDANNGRPITLRYGGSGLSSTSWLACWDGYQLAPISPANVSVGSASKLATARTLTIGNTGKTFDGSGNVSWSLSEIGAAASSHTHSYLPLSGGRMTGPIINGGLIFSNGDNYTTDIAPNNINWYSIGYSSSMKDGSSPWWDQYFALCINNYWGIDIRARDANGMRLNGNIILNAGNYNSYSPTLTGGGASGTWGINITGSSASCTGNAATSTLASYALKMQTYKQGSTTETYGTSYPLYAQWESSNVLKLKCDNFTVKTDTATQLATSRTIQTNLGSTSSASFNGTENITPGVTGTLAVGNGGTGSTSKSGARTNLGITSGTSLPSASGYATGDIFILY